MAAFACLRTENRGMVDRETCHVGRGPAAMPAPAANVPLIETYSTGSPFLAKYSRAILIDCTYSTLAALLGSTTRTYGRAHAAA
jgi:hypothetical protein